MNSKSNLEKFYYLIFVLISSAMYFYSGLALASDEDTKGGSQELLEELKKELLNQTIESGLSLASSGYIDSTGKLFESTFYETTSRISAVRNLNFRKKQSKNSNINRIIDLVSNEENKCVKHHRIYKKRIGIQFNDKITGEFDGNVKEEIKKNLEKEISQKLLSSSQWYIASGVQNKFQTPSTKYFSVLNRRNENISENRYLIIVDLKDSNNILSIPASLKRIKSSSVGLMSSVSNSRFVNNLTADKFQKKRRAVVTMSAIDLDLGKTLISRIFSLSVEKSAYNLRSESLSVSNINKIREQAVFFASELTSFDACEFEDIKINSYSQISVNSNQKIRLGIGSREGVNEGDLFIMSPSTFTGYNSLLDPSILENLAIGEVIDVNSSNAEVKILSGNFLKTYRSAIPF
ncbi:hypothetical protein N9C14_02015 [Gammaproteobacteria bacterium]|nr:hypothetical protein [Gammaproteobacteria bacterium]MDB2376145.1 hypothetical protein [Gammaproteobacteria bacterium]